MNRIVRGTKRAGAKTKREGEGVASLETIERMGLVALAFASVVHSLGRDAQRQLVHREGVEEHHERVQEHAASDNEYEREGAGHRHHLKWQTRTNTTMHMRNHLMK